MITSWMAPGMQNFVATGLGVSAPQIRDFAMSFDVTSFFLGFWVLHTTFPSGSSPPTRWYSADLGQLACYQPSRGL